MIRGPRPADFLNTLGITRTYNSIRIRNNNSNEEYPPKGWEFDLGQLKGYRVPRGTTAKVIGYLYCDGIHTEVKYPYGTTYVPLDIILDCYRNNNQS